ncbi:hypothetical protein [Flavobacterium aciduliphilum]|uniref:Prolyl-tRNA synthetase n=1 Tax=Flavobacterium aciduliphilum TaxID=1101402 RepID=A0A328Y9U5_9FLAO|nr:hypothetical protein [Flavobacterium aciduliphilum]RAR70841.1 hypothetical protein CLV55_10994 [Flavobacterium aciduliphilum]
MKTNQYLIKKTSLFFFFAVLTITANSCGSYQNSSYYDNDGIYGTSENVRPERHETARNGNYYKDYFSSLHKDNEQVFTDVDKYSTYKDSIAPNNAAPNQNSNDYAGWGSNPSTTTVNVYTNGWYTPSWGRYYGNYWGYNGWYGNSWGYNSWYAPSWSLSWGWYGPYYNYYGYGYYPYGYYYPNYFGYYGGGYWGWTNGHIGHTYAYSGGRRNNEFIGGIGSSTGGFGSGVRASNGGRIVGVPTNMPRNYNTLSTPRISVYSPRQSDYTPRTYNPSSTPNYNTPRSYSPSNSNYNYNTPRSYSPSTPSYSSPRSYAPSGGGFGGGGFSGGGGRAGGGGGGRR